MTSLEVQHGAVSTMIAQAKAQANLSKTAVDGARRRLSHAKVQHLRAHADRSRERARELMVALYEELAETVAAEKLAHQNNPTARPFPPSATPANVFGPAGEIMHCLATFGWADDWRPAFAIPRPAHTEFWPDDRPAAVAAAARLRAEIGE